MQQQGDTAVDAAAYDYRGQVWPADDLARFLLAESGEFDEEDRDFYAGAPLTDLVAALAERYGLDPGSLDDFDTDVVPRPAV